MHKIFSNFKQRASRAWHGGGAEASPPSGAQLLNGRNGKFFLGIQMETGSRSGYTGSWILLKSPKILDPWILLDLDPSGSATLKKQYTKMEDVNYRYFYHANLYNVMYIYPSNASTAYDYRHVLRLL